MSKNGRHTRRGASVDLNFRQRRFDGAEEGGGLRGPTVAAVQALDLADEADEVVPGEVRGVAVREGDGPEAGDQLGLQLAEVVVDAGLSRLHGVDLGVVGVQRALQVRHLHPQAPYLLLHRLVGRADLLDFSV